MFRPLITKTIKNTHFYFAHHNKSFNNKFDSQFLYLGSSAINKNNIFKMSLEQYGNNTPFNSNKLSYGQEIAYLSCVEGNKILFYYAAKDSKDIIDKYLYNFIKLNLTNGYNNNLQMLDELTQDKLTKQIEQNKQTTNKDKDNDDQKQSINDNDNDEDSALKYTPYKYTPYKYKN